MIKTIVNEFDENTYIFNEKHEVYVIDPGSNYQGIKEYIDKANFQVLGILLTHGHFDHIISLNQLLKYYNTKVYIHKSESDFLFDSNLNLSMMTPTKFIINDKSKVIEITEKTEFKLGRETIKVIHTPGHSRGSVCYKYKKAIFTGDTLFKGSIGRTDLPSSSRSNIEKSVKKIITICKDNTTVYPGHGQFTTILNEKRENPYIER